MTESIDEPTTYAGPSLKKILKGDTPVILVHKSVQGAQRIGEVFEQIPLLHGKSLGLGTIIRLPSMSSEKAREYLSKHDSVPIRFADPELHIHPQSGWQDAPPNLSHSAQNWTYLSAPPSKPSALWVDEVLKIQVDHGASALLTASGWVSEVNAQKSLDLAMQFVSMSRDRAPAAPLFVNLAMDSRWLTEPGLREILLGEIVESGQVPWSGVTNILRE
ncbi:hypothetical protein [Herbiconiux sp.]|uniref:hypothetical protein n=1 Tax=Herbiconiux sp. TaxID=1871186 RepID=UPI0025C3BEB4|nr:hypothetical protein [Herbiconiux sp.]